jgi:cytochrome bd-type quinol oxidase subunit 2
VLTTIGLSLLAVVAGYAVGLFGGMFLISRLSSNRHDRSVEAATTAALIVGPACALLALVATLFLRLGGSGS